MPNESFMPRLQALYQDPRFALAADIFLKGAAALSLIYVVSVYAGLPVLPVFGHDEPHYHLYYRFALTDDGRWLNYLLHGTWRSIPLPLWSVLYVALGWGVLFQLVRTFVSSAPLAAVAASTLLLTPPFVEISLWPSSFVPAFACLGFALWMQWRGIAYPVIYLVCGVLIFGTIQTVYFVLPLMFLQQFMDSGQPMLARGLLLLKHLLWWVAGSVAGVLVVCLMLWLLLGLYFPQPAAWRNTHPVSDWASLVENVRYAADYLYRLLKLFLLNGGMAYKFIGFCAVVALLRVRGLLRETPAFVLLGAVALSFFAFSVPLAPQIHMRSLVAMAAAVIVGLALLPGSSAPGRMLAAVLLLIPASDYATLGKNHIQTQHDETAVYLYTLRSLFPGYPMAYSALALDGMMDPARPEARRFNDSSLMHPLLASLGVSNIIDCRIPGRCEQLGPRGAPISTVPFAGGWLELSVTAANVGVVSYRGPDMQPALPTPAGESVGLAQ